MFRFCSGAFFAARTKATGNVSGRSGLIARYFQSKETAAGLKDQSQGESISDTTQRDLNSSSDGSQLSDVGSNEFGVSAPRSQAMGTPEVEQSTALEIANRRREAIIEAGGYSRIVVRETQYTDLTKVKKRRGRIQRQYILAQKPVMLRKHNVMPTKDTQIPPKPKIVLSPQFPISYKEKISLEAELEMVPMDDFDYNPKDSHPYMEKSHFFPAYMRTIAFVSHFLCVFFLIYFFLFLEWEEETVVEPLRVRFHTFLLNYFSLEPAEMTILARREAELEAAYPMPDSTKIKKAEIELYEARMKSRDSLSFAPVARADPPLLLKA